MLIPIFSMNCDEKYTTETINYLTYVVHFPNFRKHFGKKYKDYHNKNYAWALKCGSTDQSKSSPLCVNHAYIKE